MRDVAALQDRKTDNQALEWIRGLWKSGVVVLPPHGDERFEQSGFSDADIWNVLKHGRIIKTETPIRLVRHTIRGKSVDGAVVICSVEVDENELIIVTVFEEL